MLQQTIAQQPQAEPNNPAPGFKNNRTIAVHIAILIPLLSSERACYSRQYLPLIPQYFC